MRKEALVVSLAVCALMVGCRTPQFVVNVPSGGSKGKRTLPPAGKQKGKGGSGGQQSGGSGKLSIPPGGLQNLPGVGKPQLPPAGKRQGTIQGSTIPPAARHKGQKGGASAPDTTVIPGDGEWDVETDTARHRVNARDFRWQRNPATQLARLLPMNGAEAAVTLKGFQNVDWNYVHTLDKQQSLSSAPIPRKELRPRTVVVFKTAGREANYGKFRVVGYRAAHDFSFPDAKKLGNKYKQEVLKGAPNVPDYHLEVEYVFFGKP